MAEEQEYVNAVMIPEESSRAPCLVRAPNADLAKRRLLSRLDGQPRDVYFTTSEGVFYTVQVGLTPPILYVATVWLVSDKVAEALQLTEYMKLFHKDWGPSRVTVLATTEKIVEVKERLEDICRRYHLEVDWFADYVNEEGDVIPAPEEI